MALLARLTPPHGPSDLSGVPREDAERMLRVRRTPHLPNRGRAMEKMDPLIRTKLRLPFSRADLVSRTRRPDDPGIIQGPGPKPGRNRQ